MTILLYEDGRLLIDKADPLPTADLDGLVAYIANPSEGQVLTFNGSYWTNADIPEPEPDLEPAAGGDS